MSRSLYLWCPSPTAPSAEVNGGRVAGDGKPFLVRSSAPPTDAAGRSRKSDRVSVIAAGNRRCLVATASGVEHWGIKFGRSWDDNDQWSPKMLLPSDVQLAPRIVSRMKIRSLSCGDSHCLAIDVGSSLWSMGSNMYGQLGLGASRSQSQSKFRAVLFEEPRTVMVANAVAADVVTAATAAFLPVDMNGGQNAAAVSSQALRSSAPRKRACVHQAVAGSFHSVAIVELETGRQLFVWGKGTQGATGLMGLVSTAMMQHAPFRHPFFGSSDELRPVQIAAASSITSVVTASGRVLIFGRVETGDPHTPLIMWMPMYLRCLNVAPVDISASSSESPSAFPADFSHRELGRSQTSSDFIAAPTDSRILSYRRSRDRASAMSPLDVQQSLVRDQANRGHEDRAENIHENVVVQYRPSCLSVGAGDAFVAFHLGDGSVFAWPGSVDHCERYALNAESAEWHPLQCLQLPVFEPSDSGRVPVDIVNESMHCGLGHIAIVHGPRRDLVRLLDVKSGEFKDAAVPDGERIVSVDISLSHIMLLCERRTLFASDLNARCSEPILPKQQNFSAPAVETLESANFRLESNDCIAFACGQWLAKCPPILLALRLPSLAKFCRVSLVERSSVAEAEPAEIDSSYSQYESRLRIFLLSLPCNETRRAARVANCCGAHTVYPRMGSEVANLIDAVPSDLSQVQQFGEILRFFDQADAGPAMHSSISSALSSLRPGWYGALMNSAQRVSFDSTLEALGSHFRSALLDKPADAFDSGKSVMNASAAEHGAASLLEFDESTLPRHPYQSMASCRDRDTAAFEQFKLAVSGILNCICSVFRIQLQLADDDVATLTLDEMLAVKPIDLMDRYILREHGRIIPILGSWCRSGKLVETISQSECVLLLTYAAMWQDDELFLFAHRHLVNFVECDSRVTERLARCFKRALFRPLASPTIDNVVFLVSDLDTSSCPLPAFMAKRADRDPFSVRVSSGRATIRPFFASRAILSMRSAYFQRLLRSANSVFFVSDCAPDIFSLVVNWFYTDSVCDRVTVLQLWLLIIFADRIGAHELRRNAEEVLVRRSSDSKRQDGIFSWAFFALAQTYNAEFYQTCFVQQKRRIPISTPSIAAELDQMLHVAEPSSSVLPQFVESLVFSSTFDQTALIELATQRPASSSNAGTDRDIEFAPRMVTQEAFDSIESAHNWKSLFGLLTSATTLLTLCVFFGIVFSADSADRRGYSQAWPCALLLIASVVFSALSNVFSFMHRQRQRLVWWREHLRSDQAGRVCENRIALETAYHKIDAAIQQLVSGQYVVKWPNGDDQSLDMDRVPHAVVDMGERHGYAFGIAHDETEIESSSADVEEHALLSNIFSPRTESRSEPSLQSSFFGVSRPSEQSLAWLRLLSNARDVIAAEILRCERTLLAAPMVPWSTIYLRDASGSFDVSALHVGSVLWLRLCMLTFLIELALLCQSGGDTSNVASTWDSAALNWLWLPLHLGNAAPAAMLLYLGWHSSLRLWRQFRARMATGIGWFARVVLAVVYVAFIGVQIVLTPAFCMIAQSEMLLAKLCGASMSWLVTFSPLICLTGVVAGLVALLDVVLLILALVAALHSGARDAMSRMLSSSLRQLKPFVSLPLLIAAVALVHALCGGILAAAIELALCLDRDGRLRPDSSPQWLLPAILAQAANFSVLYMIAHVRRVARSSFYNVWTTSTDELFN